MTLDTVWIDNHPFFVPGLPSSGHDAPAAPLPDLVVPVEQARGGGTTRQEEA